MKKLAFCLACVVLLSACSSPEKKAMDSIASLEKTFEGDSITKPDRSVARELVTAYTDFVTRFPAHPDAPSLLFKAGEVANGILRTPNEAIQYYAKVCTDFPNSEKAPIALFLQGFVYENYLQRPNNARPFYEEFLKKYPDHKLAKDVRFSLDHLGMSEQDLIKMLEAKNNPQAIN